MRNIQEDLLEQIEKIEAKLEKIKAYKKELVEAYVEQNKIGEYEYETNMQFCNISLWKLEKQLKKCQKKLEKIQEVEQDCQTERE